MHPVIVYRSLKPALLESVYQRVSPDELEQRGSLVEQQKSISVADGALVIENAFDADQVVYENVIVKLMSVNEVAPVHNKTLQTY